MFESKVRIEKELLRRAERCASTAGYSSVEEFVAHAVEKEITRLEEAEFEENATKKLEGLGYIS
jgi:metal-responsive CopG/Arc/MetJ family transcriptional regulator